MMNYYKKYNEVCEKNESSLKKNLRVNQFTMKNI